MESAKDVNATPGESQKNISSHQQSPSMKDTKNDTINEMSGNLPPAQASIIEEQSALKKNNTQVLGDKSSVDGGTTNKSSRRTRQNQQRYEISDQQKINKWEETVNLYYRESLQRFNDLCK